MARKERVAVIDGSGRGAALVRAYAKSHNVESIIAIPGNDLMRIGTNKPVHTFPTVNTTSIADIVKICKSNRVSFVDVAQDDAVANGLVDVLRKKVAALCVLGPTKAAGKIEWSKAYARQLGTKYSLPQPKYQICNSEEQGIEYMQRLPKDTPVFVKASGLAKGKGSIPAETFKEAVNAIKSMASFENAGKTFLIEHWLRNEDGSNAEEFSSFAITDGNTVKIIGNAQDHKRAYNNDQGPNTGGMGCSTPPLVINDYITNKTEDIFNTMVKSLDTKGREYTGILYLGGILQRQQNKFVPSIIEWNARWGDPEAQVIVPGIKNDLFELGFSVVNHTIKDYEIQLDGKARVVVAGVSKGYPNDYSAVIGKQIYGLDNIINTEEVEVYGAGVSVQDGKYYATGGRLFYIVGDGKDVLEARSKAYAAIRRVSIEGDNLHYRDDIGWRDVARLIRSQ